MKGPIAGPELLDPGLRDRAHDGCDRPPFASARVLLGVTREIGLAHDPGESSLLVDHGNPADLVRRHQAQAAVDTSHQALRSVLSLPSRRR